MKIKRRDFLKVSTIAAISGFSSKANAQENFPGAPDRYGMLVDTTICIGANCRKCEETCKKANDRSLDDLDLTDNTVFDKARRTDPDNYTVVNRYADPKDSDNSIYVKRQCMHCDEPACASACLVKAFTKTPEGPVIYNKDICIGCRYCMVACPFYVPTYDYMDAFSPEVRKCTMCYSRIKDGKIPACAEICPKEVITFGKRNDLIKLARKKLNRDPDTYFQHIFGEKEAGGTCWLYLAGTEFSNIGFQDDLPTMPYPTYTRGFLSAVPMVLAIWPAFLVGFYKYSQNRQKLEQNNQDNPQKGK